MKSFLLTLCALSASAVPSSSFPLYKQCDTRWGDDKMGVVGDGERDSVCHQGCAMSSLSMGLAGWNVSLPGSGGALPTPGTLNKWLVGNRGYLCMGGDCCNLVLDAPDMLSSGTFQLVGEWGGKCCGGESAKPDLGSIKESLSNENSGLIFIAHVRNSSHFVLLTAWDGEKGFRVNDPGFNSTHYSPEGISDIIIYSAFPSTAVVPKRYPLTKQFDYHWRDNIMTNQTINEVGCLMSSTSMALAGHKIHIPSTTGLQESTPGSFNAWLRTHHGYVGEDDLEESAVSGVDPAHVSWPADADHRTNDLTGDDIRSLLAAGRPVIANVLHGGHFVLVVGYDSSEAVMETLYTNDPGFLNITMYHWADVVGWRLYNMTNAAAKNSAGSPSPQQSISSRVLLQNATRTLV
jgi:hypothetical protein